MTHTVWDFFSFGIKWGNRVNLFTQTHVRGNAEGEEGVKGFFFTSPSALFRSRGLAAFWETGNSFPSIGD